MVQFFNDVIVPLIAALITLLGFIPWHNAQMQKLRDDLPKAEPIIARVLAGVEALLQVPFIHKEAAPVIQIVTPVAQKLETDLVRWATIGLHGFGRALGSLSDTEKAALAEYIRRNCGDPNASAAEILIAINEAQVFADTAAGSDLFKNAVTFTQTIKNFTVHGIPGGGAGGSTKPDAILSNLSDSKPSLTIVPETAATSENASQEPE